MRLMKARHGSISLTGSLMYKETLSFRLGFRTDGISFTFSFFASGSFFFPVPVLIFFLLILWRRFLRRVSRYQEAKSSDTSW